jgi:hypothetical protein
MEKQDMMETMERLLVTINANQEKMDAKLEKAEAYKKRDIKANQENLKKKIDRKNGRQSGEGGQNPEGDAGQMGGRTEI